jgi:predicted Ser/Thr protein kinase
MADDSIPLLIGTAKNQYYLDRTQLLGDGHSGQVYAGWKVNNKALQVAIKLDKTSGAKHEWAMLKKMEGLGVPKVHYTGAMRAKAPRAPRAPCADRGP